MEAKRRYSTMVFPQGFDGNNLQLNIVLIPRNQDPFQAWPTGLPNPHPAQATAFASLAPQFEVAVCNGLEEWPIGNATVAGQVPLAIPVNVTEASNKFQLLQALANQLGAKINMDGSSADKTDKAPDTPLPENQSVQKYLPESYRTAFNFTNPRHPNAKLDDSYHCAIRKDTKKKDNWKTNDDLSWGQVFAHILRQPMLARACGLIYSVSINLQQHPGLLSKGGYIFVNIVNEEYNAIQGEILNDLANGPFIKRYAARIPALKAGEARAVFAPMLFPVLHRADGSIMDPEPPKAEWDKIFAELNEYNDGFSKIIHAAQQVSNNILSEKQDGPAPQSDTGIRLAWDDEQIMIWYLRQLSGNPLEPGKRLDVPMGVYGYRVDVRPDEENSEWASLNLVKSKAPLTVGDVQLGEPPASGIDLPYQVFPSQLDNNTSAPYWLPMYFTNWIGKSLVLKDIDAIRINRHAEAQKGPKDDTPKAVDESTPYEEIPSGVDLRYGQRYEFRVRMMDISGGGPGIKEEMVNNAAAPTAKHQFKRFMAPDLCRIVQPLALRTGKSSYWNKESMDENGDSIPNPTIEIQRPLLSYPAVVFTGKYQARGLNPVDLLIAATQQPQPMKIPGIADPDVSHVEITVEVETLKLDNLLSVSGQENYMTLYTTTRAFPDGFDDTLVLPVEFHDVAVLLAGNADNPFNQDNLDKDAIDAMTAIPLPTARRIRLTVRAVCQEESGYYGFSNLANKDLDTRYGKTAQFWFHQPCEETVVLLSPEPNVAPLQGIYLQPDPIYLNTGEISSFFLLRETSGGMPDIIQRFAQKLGLRYNGLTLMGKKGERVIFGCSQRIRHHLSPDHGSITFSSKGDLCNHWLGCVVHRLNRDWTWNALDNVSFQLKRYRKFERDDDNETEVINVLGDIEMKRSASFESLQPDEFGLINREYTTLIFIDAIEPKSSLEKKPAQGTGLRFPDQLNVRYELKARFRPNHSAPPVPLPEEEEWLRLPTTIIPSQVPEIASVGIAFSPYRANDNYSATEPRQKYLWVELAKPVEDPHDTLFCRVLAYAPDQLISHNRGIMTEVPEEPLLPIDPEYIRSITMNQTDDMAGLGAMQPMEKASGNDNLHYLLPLPPGLNAESPELFGFFTYEFRIGHGHWSAQADEKGHLWSTAQGRFGRPLRITGVQHPAPNLLCNVNRDKDRVYVTAPYAKAVWKGMNVTSDPPRTQLHGLLYAQVRQADGKGYRNILLDEKVMVLNKPVFKPIPPDKHFGGFTAANLNLARWTVDQVDKAQQANVLVSHLSLMDDSSVEQLKLDKDTNKKLLTVLNTRRLGKIDQLDAKAAINLLNAHTKLNQPGLGVDVVIPNPVPAARINAGNKFTAASVVAGAKLAIFKDIPKTATVTWTTKEISALLSQLGLPQDASLSVLVVEVFGNITNIFDHLSLPAEWLEALTKNNPKVAATIKDRQARQQFALSNQLGNYRILRTSPLTEVPFVCCPTCG